MKQSINLGAYGWRHRHWTNVFYPQDLPMQAEDDWRLSYYSNEFNAVLIPPDYWHTASLSECEDWLDSVHAGFRFYVECDVHLLEKMAAADLQAALAVLKPQLSALVILQHAMSPADKKCFTGLAENLGVELFGDKHNIWRNDEASAGRAVQAPLVSRFAYIEDSLSDLRAGRVTLERFIAQLPASTAASDTDGGETDEAEADKATIIVHSPQLQASDLSKLRSVLEIMGY